MGEVCIEGMRGSIVVVMWEGRMMRNWVAVEVEREMEVERMLVVVVIGIAVVSRIVMGKVVVIGERTGFFDVLMVEFEEIEVDWIECSSGLLVGGIDSNSVELERGLRNVDGDNPILSISPIPFPSTLTALSNRRLHHGGR